MRKYIAALQNAKRFMDDKGMRFFLRQRRYTREQISIRLRKVDPLGWKQFMKNLRLYKQIRRKDLKAARDKLKKSDTDIEIAVKNKQLAVAQKTWEDTGVSDFRFVSADTILSVIGTLKAAGYTNDELAEKLKLEHQVIEAVKPEMAKAAAKDLSEFIVKSADKRVLFDLVRGVADKGTVHADLIATRRRKGILDAQKVYDDHQGDRGLTPPDVKRKEKQYEERFGIGKKKDIEGEITDENIHTK